MTSTIFPALPQRSRTAFGVALVGLVALLVGTALPMWQAALIGLVGLGLPLLFAAYLWETDAFADLSVGTLCLTAGLGIALGIGWGIATDVAAARTDDDALGLPVSTTRILVTGLAIPVGFLVLLLAPMVLVRLWRPGIREPLHGYVFGSVAALSFTSAGSLTRLTPELAAGPVDLDGRGSAHLMVAGIIQGLAIPLTAVAVGGAIGATLWFAPRADSGSGPRWRSPTSPVPAVAFGVLVYLGLGLLDLLQVPNDVAMGVYALLAVLALVVLRIVIHSTLLPGEPERAVPAPTSRSTPPARTLLILAVGAVLVMAATAALSSWLVPPKARFVCPPDCGQPPISKPVATNPRFTPSGGEFSVSYPGPATAYDATFEPNGVVLDLHAGDGGTLRLFGQPANGQTPRQIADDLLRAHYPDATFAYEIPNAFVGYQLGYGEVADDYAADAIGDEGRNRVLIMVAVKNDYALIAAAAGPFREFTPEFGSGHPSGANFFLALDMSKYVNSFTWRGDPPR